jgi:pimeloyl-ACP methyl ester carboxylesterase
MSLDRLPADVRAWHARGKTMRLAGLDVFVVDTDPSGGEEATLVLHGFPSSSYDWRALVPSFARRRRTILLDLPGFGLSEKPGKYSYSLHEQTDVVEMALRAVNVARVHVVAHDMGTSVACEMAARRERGLLHVALRSLVLMNGSVHIELCKLTPSQRILRTPLGPLFSRLGNRRMFVAQMHRILSRPVDDAEIDAMWAQLEHLGGRASLHRLIGYVDERWRFWDRWIGALRRLDVPVLVLWGTEDPVAVFAIAEELAREIPGARLNPLRGVGHYPQLEAPDEVRGAIDAFAVPDAPQIA